MSKYFIEQYGLGVIKCDPQSQTPQGLAYRNSLILRWSVFFAMVIGTFQALLGPHAILALAHWYDILIGPIWTVIIIMSFYGKEIYYHGVKRYYSTIYYSLYGVRQVYHDEDYKWRTSLAVNLIDYLISSCVMLMAAMFLFVIFSAMNVGMIKQLLIVVPICSLMLYYGWPMMASAMKDIYVDQKTAKALIALGCLPISLVFGLLFGLIVMAFSIIVIPRVEAVLLNKKKYKAITN